MATRDEIVDTALRLAEDRSWEALRLYEIAAALDVGLNDIRVHFREKEDIVDAWFDRADGAMLALAERADFTALSSRARLVHALMAWLGALSAHRRVTRQMIVNKLEPGHLHYQAAGLLRVSRTVQWLREATARAAVLPWRAVEEAGFTGIFLTTFFFWMRDESPGSERTRALLERLLTQAERAAHWFSGGRGAAEDVGIRGAS